MKALLEKRAKLMAELDSVELRTLDEQEQKKVEEKIEQVKEIDKQLKTEQEVRNLKNTKEKEEVKEDMEKRSLILEGKEVQIEMRNMTKDNVKGETVTNGSLVADRAKELGLKDFARIERFNGNSIIPVQKQKMGKLVKAAELASITNKDVLVEQVDLRPEKYALLTVVSEELINDASYDVEGLIREEGNQAIDETIESLIATTLNGASSVKTVSDASVMSLDVINKLYFALEAKYRKNAIFIVKDEHLKALVGLVGTDGHPLLQRDLTQEFGYKLFGRPVVLCEDIENMMFVDMEKAVVAGIGKDAQVKRSDDAYFTTGGVAFRTTVALDCKPCITNAIAKLTA